MNILLAILLGGFFGFALYYAGASRPNNILSMLQLRNIRLMKIILFAIGLGSTLVSLAVFAGIFPIDHFAVKTGHLGVVIGGIIFGLGFGLGGTCPGTCVAGLGDITFNKAIAAALGGLTGALVFSNVYGLLARTGLFDTWNFGKLTLFRISGKYPSVLSIGIGGLLITGIVFMCIGYFLPMEVRKD